jgi:hypothetical protein
MEKHGPESLKHAPKYHNRTQCSEYLSELGMPLIVFRIFAYWFANHPIAEKCPPNSPEDGDT